MRYTDLANVPDGTRVRVTVEGIVATRIPPRGLTRGRKVVEIGDRSVETAYGPQKPVLTGMHLASTTASIEVVAPKWQPGDVVVVRYHFLDDTAYTYVRGSRDWPGDRQPAKSDAEISRLFGEGKAEHVLRDGKPVPPSVVAPF